MATQLAGEDILASDIVTPRYVVKSGVETVTTSAVLQDDNDFNLIALAASRVYRIEVLLAASCTGTGDIQTTFVLAGGASQLTARHSRGPASSSTTASDTTMDIAHVNLTTPLNYGLNSAGGTATIKHEFLVQTTTAGTITMQWAQDTANGATSLSASSYMILTEVEAA